MESLAQAREARREEIRASRCYGHLLRHSHATMLDSVGTPIGTMQSLLGHSAPEITREIYLHAILEEQRRAVESVERSEEHTSELQSLTNLVCRLLLEKKRIKK